MFLDDGNMIVNTDHINMIKSNDGDSHGVVLVFTEGTSVVFNMSEERMIRAIDVENRNQKSTHYNPSEKTQSNNFKPLSREELDKLPLEEIKKYRAQLLEQMNIIDEAIDWLTSY